MGITVLYQDVSGDPAVSLGRFEVGEGTWTFDQVDVTDGGALRGSFEGTLYLAP